MTIFASNGRPNSCRAATESPGVKTVVSMPFGMSLYSTAFNMDSFARSSNHFDGAVTWIFDALKISAFRCQFRAVLSFRTAG